MIDTKAKLILQELHKRKKEAEERLLFNIKDICFDPQLEFILDQSKYKSACTSRRAGKSVSCVLILLDTATRFDRINCLYVTLSRKTAKTLIWKELIYYNKFYKLKGIPNLAELSLTFPNGSSIYLGGAKDQNAIEKFRGLHLKVAIIDEAQSFRQSLLMSLLDEILVPALIDYDGQLILTGTPGLIAAGYFFEACNLGGFSNHHWTLRENPHIAIKSGKNVQDIIDQEKKRRGIDETDPTYQREIDGKWVNDFNSLVFKYSPSKNHYDNLPVGTRKSYVLGIDIGFQDCDAIAVLGYDMVNKKVYLVEEVITQKQDISALADQIRELKEKYDPVKMVIDAGALGKKITEEIINRHSLYLEPADKTRKLEFIELLNDDLRTGKLLAKRDSRFAEDCSLVSFDKESMVKQNPKISMSYHSDITDAVLYAWRVCYHYLAEQPSMKIQVDTDEWMDLMEKKEARDQEEQKNNPYYEIDKLIEEDMELIDLDNDFYID